MTATTVQKLFEISADQHVLVIDLEATCCISGSIPKGEMEIIQIGAVVSSVRGEVTFEWVEKVRPVRHPQLTEFCTRLTGIEQSDVDAVASFPVVMDRFISWTRSIPVDVSAWASWGAYDLHQFRQDVDFHNLDWPLPVEHLNLKAMFSKRFKLKKRPALSTALGILEMTFEGQQHNALDDARNAARLLPYALKERRASIEDASSF